MMTSQQEMSRATQNHNGGGNQVSVVLGLSGLTVRSGDYEIAQDQTFRFEMPSRFEAEHIDIASNDLRIFQEMLQRYPGAIADLHNAVIRGDQDVVREIVSTVGLTEESFKAQGGGMWIWIALVGGFIAAHAMFTRPQ